MKHETFSSFFYIIFLVLAILFFGTTGYMIIEGWSALDAFYMVVITLATVGYREVGPLSSAGKIFTIILIIFGIGTIVYFFKWFFEYILGGHLGSKFKEKQIKRKISRLSNHFIICGCGRVGRQIGEEFQNEEVPFVITDQNKERVKFAEKKGWLFLVGDATSEDFLEQLEIKKARGLLTVVDEDQDNVFITLTARSLNPNLFIIARASQEENISKLYKAGADKVDIPYKIGGFHMAAIALRPAVVDFLDAVVGAQNRNLFIEDIKVHSEFYIGKSLGEVLPQKSLGIAILAVNRSDGSSAISPNPDFILEPDDRLIIMGQKEALKKIKERIEGKKLKINS